MADDTRKQPRKLLLGMHSAFDDQISVGDEEREAAERRG